MLSVHCKFPEGRLELSTFPKLFATESFFCRTNPTDTAFPGIHSVQSPLWNDRNDWTWSTTQAPTAALAIGHDLCLYPGSCCQLVPCIGPSWPPTPALLGPTCPAGISCQPTQPRAAGQVAIWGSMSVFCRNASCRGCPQVTIQKKHDPLSTIILISTLSHNE